MVGSSQHIYIYIYKQLSAHSLFRLTAKDLDCDLSSLQCLRVYIYQLSASTLIL